MLLLLAACGEPGGRDAGATGTVHIYNWSDYIDPALLDRFTRETGIKVRYDTFDSNEVLETKLLQGGSGYDLAVPSNHNVPRYVAAHAIQPLDKAQLPNLKGLDPAVVARTDSFDPGGRYAVPYMQGTIGIGYNEAAVAKRLAAHERRQLGRGVRPANLAKLKDCGVYFLDASEDMYAVALNYLGQGPELDQTRRLCGRHGHAAQGPPLCAEVPLVGIHRRPR